MKKWIVLILLVMTMTSCFACKKGEVMDVEATDAVEKTASITPQAAQMKSICELATMQCYYHNVAKYYEKDASGILLWKKDRRFWVEYSGVVTVGIDTSLVSIVVEGENVTITIPPAEVLDCKVDEKTLTEDSFIVAKDSASVEAEHQTKAFKEAQAKMEEAASQDTVLLTNAQQRAQKLLEDYVNNIGDCTGVTYRIQWIYLDGAAKTETPEENTEIESDKGK